MLQQTIFCNNCGDRGHAFRECKRPVLSCGIILLQSKSNPTKPTTLPLDMNDIQVLMIRRKDSMSYTEFMRGKYDPSDVKYVYTLLQNMTQYELDSLKTVPFDLLWSKLWINIERHEHELPSSHEKFQRVFNIIKDVNSTFTEPEWGFPKGRRFRCESDQQCAEREFFEETNIPRSAYITVKDVEFTETFVGTNGIPYQHKYFLGIVVHPEQLDIEQRLTPTQKREISAVDWKSISDCKNLTRPHYTGREKLLNDLVSFVNAVEVRIPNFLGDDNGNTGNRFGT